MSLEAYNTMRERLGFGSLEDVLEPSAAPAEENTPKAENASETVSEASERVSGQPKKTPAKKTVISFRADPADAAKWRRYVEEKGLRFDAFYTFALTEYIERHP